MRATSATSRSCADALRLRGRQATDRRVLENVGRLPVDRREAPLVPTGILTRSDWLSAHGLRLEASTRRKRHLDLQMKAEGSGATERPL